MHVCVIGAAMYACVCNWRGYVCMCVIGEAMYACVCSE